jgi:phosphoribosylformylglycinamidine (FGAM) synthase-like enzyme
MATAKKPDTKVAPPAGTSEVPAVPSRSLGLNDAELTRAVKELGRSPNPVELGVLGVMWSEREAQKSSRAHLKRLPGGGSHAVSMPGHCAGALEIGGGQCVVIALSTAEAGDSAQAATASAGHALRSVLAAGGKPLALLDSVHLGAPEAPETAQALRGLAARLGVYARDAGVPVVGGNLQFDKRYHPDALVQSVAVGVAKTDALVEGRATGPGNTLLFVGASAGGREAEGGDAYAQRRLSDACLAAYQLGSVAGAYAIGPSGLAAAVVRLAENGETGVELDLDAVPRKAGEIAPAELLCTAGAEQMLLVVRKGREEAVIKALAPFDVEAQIVGRVTNTGRILCKSAQGKGDAKQAPVLVDLPIALLTRDAPSYERPLKPASIDKARPEVTLKRNEDAESELVRLLGSSNVGSREWLIRKLDTAPRPAASSKGPGDAALIVLPADDDGAGERLFALSVDGNARWLSLDPRQGAAMTVAECARNLVCVGAEPLGLAHGLSFADPTEPHTMWQLSEAVDGVHDASLALKIPVLTGAVSFGAAHAPGTPTIAVFGVLRDAADRVGIGFGRQADMIALLGAQGSGNLAGSELAVSRGQASGASPVLDLGAEVKLQRAVLELARERLLSSAHDISDGGVGVALAESCIAGRIGCSIELPGIGGASSLQALFHEEPSRVLVSFPPEHRAKVQERCSALGVPFELLGFVGGDTLEIEDLVDVPVQVLTESHVRALDRLVEA